VLTGAKHGVNAETVHEHADETALPGLIAISRGDDGDDGDDGDARRAG
jgi:hypothetical protein